MAGACGVALTLAVFGIVTLARSADRDDFERTSVTGAALAPGAREMLVGCEPGQVAVFRSNAGGIEGVQCVSTGYAVTPQASFAPVQTVGAGVLAAPAVYAQSAPAPAPAPVLRAPATRASGRSWQKTALIIGGSTAAGAGVGGLMGGKKGALIGAAIGGGASTIYEAAKR
jgi:hypothetical protein